MKGSPKTTGKEIPYSPGAVWLFSHVWVKIWDCFFNCWVQQIPNCSGWTSKRWTANH